MNTTLTTESRQILLSKKGMKELKKTVTRLEHDRRMAIQELRESNTSSTRDERMARIEKLAHLEAIEGELGEKQTTLSTAKIIPTRRARLRVAIGSVVDLIDQQGRLFRYTLVDSIEADPSDGRISIVSPLGQSLVGKTVQDMVEWSAGIRANRLQLIGIK